MNTTTNNPTDSGSPTNSSSTTDEGYFLGIDIGTQGLTALLTDNTPNLSVVATADADYGFVPDLPAGCYEQTTEDWESALHEACRKLRRQLVVQRGVLDTQTAIKILAIGISGQMHGEVMIDEMGQVINPVRVWCDGRNADEADELTAVLQTKCPQRMTAVRFLWTARHRKRRAERTCRLTTPAGWLSYRLTGGRHHVLGVGDAAGMFPVTTTPNGGGYDYHAEKLALYDELLQRTGLNKKLQDLLPAIRVAGQDAGSVTAEGAKLLSELFQDSEDRTDTEDGTAMLVGIPIASAEGDQVAALAGSLVGQAGTVACSFGTSVCANVVADPTAAAFHGVSSAVDHFCAADGTPIHMVWLRNGTTFFNTTVETFRRDDETTEEAFQRLMPAVLAAPLDCGGLLALPFMDDEPGLQVTTGPSTALTLGWTTANATPGNIIQAALLSTAFNLKAGVQVLRDQNVVHLRQIVLSGGLVKTPALGQIVANVFDCPVRLLSAADEGSSWGAAVMAAYRHQCWALSSNTNNNNSNNKILSWPTFLQRMAERHYTPAPTQFLPQHDAVEVYARVYTKYQKLRALEGSLRDLQR